MGVGLGIEVIEVVYTCSVCGDTFGSQADLDTHIRTEHIAGIPDWLGKYWPVLAITGIGITLFTVFWFKKKK